MTITGSRDRQENRELMLADYSRKRLLTYADSFQEIAHCLGEDCYPDSEDRVQCLENYSMWEKQQVLCSHMAEVSRILEKMATEVFRTEKRENCSGRHILYTEHGNRGRK